MADIKYALKGLVITVGETAFGTAELNEKIAESVGVVANWMREHQELVKVLAGVGVALGTITTGLYAATKAFGLAKETVGMVRTVIAWYTTRVTASTAAITAETAALGANTAAQTANAAAVRGAGAARSAGAAVRGAGAARSAGAAVRGAGAARSAGAAVRGAGAARSAGAAVRGAGAATMGGAGAAGAATSVAFAVVAAAAVVGFVYESNKRFKEVMVPAEEAIDSFKNVLKDAGEEIPEDKKAWWQKWQDFIWKIFGPLGGWAILASRKASEAEKYAYAAEMSVSREQAGGAAEEEVW